MAIKHVGAVTAFLLSLGLVPNAMSEVDGADDEIHISAIVALKLPPILDETVDYYDILRFTYSSSITTSDGRPWCHLEQMRISHACDLPDGLGEFAGLTLGFSSSSDNDHYNSFPGHSFECELTDFSEEFWRLKVVNADIGSQAVRQRNEYELILSKDDIGALSFLSSFPSASSQVVSYSGRTYVDRGELGLSVEDHRPLAKQRVRDSSVQVLTLECPYIRFPLVGR